MSVNKIYLVGNLGADPELRYTPTGAPVTTFTLATNEHYQDQEGKQQERTEWHRLVAWGKMAERCADMLRKGSQVYVDGKITSNKWQDRDGVDRTTTEIKIDQMRMFWAPEKNRVNPPQTYGKVSARSSEKADFLDDFDRPMVNPEDDIPF